MTGGTKDKKAWAGVGTGAGTGAREGARERAGAGTSVRVGAAAGISEMLSFGGAQFATAIYMAFTSYYLMMFLTDVALIPPAIIAVLLFCFRLFSAADTQAVGIIINRNRFKDGKYRPYFKWCALPFALSLAALGVVPGFGIPGRIIYIVIVLVICDLCWSLLNMASISMLPYLAGDDVNRSKFMSFSNGSAIFAYILAGTFMLPLADALSGGDRRNGFAMTLMLLAIITVPLIFNAYFRLREHNYSEPATKPSIKEIFIAIGSNKRVILFMVGLLLYFMADAFKNQTTYYYLTFVMGRPDMLPVIIMAGLISPLVMQPVIPQLLKIAKKEWLIVFGLFAASFASFLMLTTTNIIIALIVCVVLYGMFTSIVANLSFTVIASFSDEMRVSQDISMSEILAATMNFVSNIGSGIASGVAAMVMAISGYSALVATQTTLALTGIKSLYILCTAAGMVIAGVVTLSAMRERRADSKA